jgi:hypothetical protein
VERLEIWRIVAELDEASFRRLGLELRSLGYVFDLASLKATGSQQRQEWHIDGPRGSLIVEAGKSIGLTVTGPASVVEGLRKKYCTDYPISLWAREQSKRSH